MKLIAVLAVVSFVAANENHYDAKYDNVDIDEAVSNTRLLSGYAHCFIGDGKCTAEGSDFKKWIPEGSRTACAKCTPKQKIIVAKFIKAIQEQLPKEWEALSKLGDPDGKNKEELQKFLAEYAQ